MNYLDLTIGIILGLMLILGYRSGLVHTIVSLVGSILGIILASRYYGILATWLIHITGWTGNFPQVAALFVAFLIINRLVTFVFSLLDKSFAIVNHLPIIGGINKILGGLFSLFEGMVVLGVLFYFVARYPLGAAFMQALGTSVLAHLCLSATQFVIPFIPSSVQALKSYL